MYIAGMENYTIVMAIKYQIEQDATVSAFLRSAKTKAKSQRKRY